MTLTSPTLPTRRDRWGRYQVVPPTGGKPTGYTRATTVAKALDDGSGLIGWSKRMVALGLAQRPDLIALTAATGPNDKRALDDICERAAEAGGSTVRRDLGTAIHGMLEQSWGDPNYQAPAPYTADIAAVHQALAAAGLTVDITMIERIVVNDTHQIAGTFDLMVRDSAGALRVADIKTGSSLAGALSFAIQLAIYANADALYTQGAAADGSQDVREPMPQLATDYGFIIHVQPESGTCDIHRLDLTVGAEALELAVAVRAMNKAKPLTPYTPSDTPPAVERITDLNLPMGADLIVHHFPGAEPVPEVDEQWRDWMRSRMRAIDEAGHIQALVMHWPAGTPTLRSGDPISIGQSVDIEHAVSLIEREFEMPFMPRPEQPKAPVEPTPTATRRRAPAEGRTISEPTIAKVNELVTALGTDEKAWIGSIVAGAHAANYPLKLSGPGGKPTQRRALIAKALVTLAQFADEQLTRALVELAMTEELQPAHDLPQAIGALRLEEAKRLDRLAAAVADTSIVPIWHDDTVTFTGDINAALAA